MCQHPKTKSQNKLHMSTRDGKGRFGLAGGSKFVTNLACFQVEIDLGPAPRGSVTKLLAPA